MNCRWEKKEYSICHKNYKMIGKPVEDKDKGGNNNTPLPHKLK